MLVAMTRAVLLPKLAVLLSKLQDKGPQSQARSFKSSIDRDITVWNSLIDVGDLELNDPDFKLLSRTLKGFGLIDDLFRKASYHNCGFSLI